MEDTENIRVNDIVDFQPYPEQNRPECLGSVTRIGTANDLGMLTYDGDDRIFYELESLGQNPYVFTRTTREWITKIK